VTWFLLFNLTKLIFRIFKRAARTSFSYYTAAWGLDILRNVIDCFGICYIPPNQQVFRKYIILSLVTKCFRGRWNGFVGQILPDSCSMETVV